MVLALCILAIIISIIVGWKWKFNTGIIALAFAFLIGFFGLGLSINEIISFWPTTIVFYLLAISLFFNYPTNNGTMDVLGKKLLYALGGNAKLVPFVIMVVCAIVGGLGAGASTPVIVGPFCFVMAVSAGVSPVTTALAIALGNVMGSNNPYNGYGGVISKNLIMANGVDEQTAVTTTNFIWVNVMIIAVIMIVIFYFALKDFRAKKVKVDQPPKFSKDQKKTLIVVLCAFVLMVVPAILNSMVKNDVIAKIAGFCQPQAIMIVGSFVCACMKLGKEKDIIKQIPVSTIVMIVGVYTLIQVAAAAGLVDFISHALANSIPKFLVPAAIVLFAAFLSFFSSSTSTVMPLMYPLVPMLSAELGLNPIMLYTCIFWGGLSTAVSPFSTGGAITIAACPIDEVREGLPNKMIITALVMPAITMILVTLGIFNIFSM